MIPRTRFQRAGRLGYATGYCRSTHIRGGRSSNTRLRSDRKLGGGRGVRDCREVQTDRFFSALSAFSTRCRKVNVPLHDFKSFPPPRPRLTVTNFCAGNRRRTNGTPTKTEQRYTVMTRGTARTVETVRPAKRHGRTDGRAGKAFGGKGERGRTRPGTPPSSRRVSLRRQRRRQRFLASDRLALFHSRSLAATDGYYRSARARARKYAYAREEKSPPPPHGPSSAVFLV